MRVLNVNVTVDPNGGGTSERTFQMCRFLVKAGVDCTILTTDIGLTSARIEALQGVRVVALHCIWKRYYISRLSYDTIKKEVAAADIIHIMGHWGMLNA